MGSVLLLFAPTAITPCISLENAFVLQAKVKERQNIPRYRLYHFGWLQLVTLSNVSFFTPTIQKLAPQQLINHSASENVYRICVFWISNHLKKELR
jgi:hypothetical protein